MFIFVISECNRTYYGEVGKTYRLTIPRPRADKLPFVCSLNLVANQYEMGDFVQVVCVSMELQDFICKGEPSYKKVSL